jgi:DNA-directed RNA polymerase
LHSTQPAFHHHSSYMQGKRIGSIAPHHEIEKKLRAESVHGISMVKLPMLVEPKPWKAFDEGGYYTAREFAVRTKIGDNSQTAYAQSAIDHGDMNKVLAGLDVLGLSMVTSTELQLKPGTQVKVSGSSYQRRIRSCGQRTLRLTLRTPIELNG